MKSEEINHLSVSKLNAKFQIFSEILVSDNWGGAMIVSMFKLNLKFQIFSELLVGDIRRGQ